MDRATLYTEYYCIKTTFGLALHWFHDTLTVPVTVAVVTTPRNEELFVFSTNNLTETSMVLYKPRFWCYSYRHHRWNSWWKWLFWQWHRIDLCFYWCVWICCRSSCFFRVATCSETKRFCSMNALFFSARNRRREIKVLQYNQTQFFCIVITPEVSKECLKSFWRGWAVLMESSLQWNQYYHAINDPGMCQLLKFGTELR